MLNRTTFLRAMYLASAVLLALLITPLGRVSAAGGPIKWIIPYPTGGAYDRLSRGLAPILSKKFGVPVVVEIIPGPEGYSKIINAKPDGQTIGMSEPVSVFATALLTKPAYDLNKLDWLGRIDAAINLIVAPKKSGITSIQQVFQHEGPVRGAAFGVTTPILQQLFLADATGFKVRVVNFQTISGLIVGTVRGDVDIADLGAQPWLKHIEAGNVVPLLAWDTERDPRYPNVPSLKDVGHPDLVTFTNHRSVVAPPGLPADVEAKIVKVFQDTISAGEGKAFLEKAHFETNQLWGKPFRDIVAKLKQSLKTKEDVIRELAK